MLGTMVSILGGSLAALAWGLSTLAASRAAAAVGSRVVLAWVMLVGIALAVPITLAGPVPSLDAAALALLAVSGLGNVLGLLLAYTAMATGKVSLVAPIVATQGAGAAVIAIVLGESVGLPVIAALAIAAVGVVLVSWERRGPEPRTNAAQERRAAILAIIAAALFAVALYATGRIGAELSVGLTVLPSRLIGVVFVTLPLLARGGLSISRRVLPVVLLMGVLEVVGVMGIALGSTDAISITVVISSQFAAVAALGAFVMFGERIQRHQLVGIVLILIGVAGVALLRAGG
jgi:drug/metabolite transporter (DMT)-like permease